MPEEHGNTSQRGPHSLTRSQVCISIGTCVASAFLLGWAYIRISDRTNLYGTGFFAGLPFFSGIVATVVNGRFSIPTAMQSTTISLVAYGIISLIGLAFAAEGIICLLMAAPIAIPSMILGSRLIAWVFTASHRKNIPTSSLGLLPLVPILTISSSKLQLDPIERSESTEIVINASPKRIWPLLFNLNQIDDPEWPLFQVGIAHPTSVSSQSINVGARRDCHLSTGDMAERISMIEKFRKLRFEVLSTPPTMKEINPFWEVESAHLTGYYTCKTGEFSLVPLPHGQTKLIGTSWYEHRIYPAFYWNLWTDCIVEHVHTSVMEEIKQRAEAD